MTRTIEPSDRDYPDGMALVSSSASWARPPPRLYLRGQLPLVPGVAIVGRREPTAEAAEFSRALASAVAAEGWAVWSGGAFGIDAAAHEGALDAGGITVAVVTGCFDSPAPAPHAALFERIVATGGALLSLEPPGADRHNFQYLRRNLVMAALAHATVVVQAGGARSGALAMGRRSLRVGRPTLAVPHPPWSAVGAGCALLLRQGAYPIASSEDAMQSLRDIIHQQRLPSGMLTTPPRSVAGGAGAHGAGTGGGGAGGGGAGGGGRRRAADDSLDGDTRAVLAALDSEGRHVDQLCQLTGLAAPRVNRALLTLTLHGLSLRTAQGAHCRAP